MNASEWLRENRESLVAEGLEERFIRVLLQEEGCETVDMDGIMGDGSCPMAEVSQHLRYYCGSSNQWDEMTKDHEALPLGRLLKEIWKNKPDWA